MLRFGQDASRLPCQMDRSAMEMCGALSYDIYMEVIHEAPKNLGVCQMKLCWAQVNEAES